MLSAPCGPRAERRYFSKTNTERPLLLVVYPNSERGWESERERERERGAGETVIEYFNFTESSGACDFHGDQSCQGDEEMSTRAGYTPSFCFHRLIFTKYPQFYGCDGTPLIMALRNVVEIT
jgi:hypothetical protein